MTQRLVRPPREAGFTDRFRFFSDLDKALDAEKVEPEGVFVVSAPTRVARARTTDPTTSHEAAASIKDLTANQRAVHRIFLDWQGTAMTDDTLVSRYTQAAEANRFPAIPYQSPSGIRSRRSELVHDGFIENTGAKAINGNGNKAILWGLRDPVNDSTEED